MIKAVIFDCFGVVLGIMSDTKNPKVIELIKSLRPEFRLAMLSNISGRASLDRRFDPGELDELFDAVVPSGDVGFEKPDPEIYEMAAARLGVDPSECLFIDDIEAFCTAAEAVGMQSVRFVDTEVALKEINEKLEASRASQS